MRPIVFVASLALLSLSWAGAALAHAHLQSADPAVGSEVTGPLSVLHLTFSEGIVPDLSGVSVETAAGAAIGSQTLAVDPGQPTRVTLTLATPLPAGVYRVKWHVVSVDTHKTQGDYSFTVK